MPTTEDGDATRRRKWLVPAAGLALVLAGLTPFDVPEEVFYAGLLLLGIGVLGPVASNYPGSCAFLVVALPLAAMVGVFPLPTIERPLVDRTRPSREAQGAEADDRLEDKRPAFVRGLSFRGRLGAREQAVNKSLSVVSVDVAQFAPAERDIAGKTYPTLAAACEAARGFTCHLLPSVDMLGAVQKHVDDRLMAALEEALHRGDGLFRGGKQGFLAELATEVLARGSPAGRERAAALLAAAVSLGGDEPRLPADVAALGRTLAQEFLTDPLASRPIGLYSRSETLSAVFRRDRFLQQPLSLESGEAAPVIACLAAALARRPDLESAYRRFLAIGNRLTNPGVNPSLEDVLAHRELLDRPAELALAIRASPRWAQLAAMGQTRADERGVAVWPPATSREGRLYARLYATSPSLPEGDVMADLVAAVRGGRVKLAPEPGSGWYDHQQFALETLLLPERAQEAPKLLLSGPYKKRLRQAFEAMITKHRETHVKMLHLGATGTALRLVPPEPVVHVEPVATNYLRVARAYGFLARALEEAAGAPLLARIPGATPGSTLAAEVAAVERRYYAAYLVVCDDLGMAPALAAAELASLRAGLPQEPAGEASSDSESCTVAQVDGLSEADRALIRRLWHEGRTWLEELPRHPALAEDQRVIVPVLASGDRSRARYWAVLGAKLSRIKLAYAVPPLVGSLVTVMEEDAADRAAVVQEAVRSGNWRPVEFAIPVSVFREVTLSSTPPTREEFRAACDRGATEEGILTELGAATGGRRRAAGIALVLLAGLVVVAVVARRRDRRQPTGPAGV